MVSVQYYLLFKGDRHIFDSCKKRAVNVKLVTFSHQNIASAVVLHHDASVGIGKYVQDNRARSKNSLKISNFHKNGSFHLLPVKMIW